MRSIDATLRDAFDAYRRTVDETEALLTALDERSGDGDFGANLRSGLARAATRAADSNGLRTWALLSDVFLDGVGGTSGPLFGLLFQQLHRHATTAQSVDALLRAGIRDGLAAIQRVGEAQPGDRTLVDALFPAAEALDHGGLKEAARAAVDGAIATRELLARRGRASYVGSRAVGYPDPGAIGVALLFLAFGEAAGIDLAGARSRLLHAAEIPEAAGPAAAGVSRELEEILAAAQAARAPLAALTLDERAGILDGLADALAAHRDELVTIAEQETHLSRTRLSGELERTRFQLTLFGEIVRAGAFRDVRIDHADPDWPAGPRPDLRRSNRPIGPVLVFAASNFPFAFSVLGGDTASALAAGNPVIVKAHPGHPRLSLRTAEIARVALSESAAPTGTFALIAGDANGVAALGSSQIKAAAFTGSISGGRALLAIAQTRPDPIPFFGELGSNNPVFVTAAADGTDADAIADGFVTSFTLGAGQFCTKPGTLFVPTESMTAVALRARILPAATPLLNDRILDGYRGRLRELSNAPGVVTLRLDGDAYADPPSPILLRTTGTDVLKNPRLYLDECFGPAALVVEYDSPQQLVHLAEAYEGQLTATVFGTDADAPYDLIAALTERVGRLLWRQWPTGVAVTDAQQHGGPYPASTASQTTSVGTAAITRFLRPVAMQGFPRRLLPGELIDDEPPHRHVRAVACP